MDATPKPADFTKKVPGMLEKDGVDLFAPDELASANADMIASVIGSMSAGTYSFVQRAIAKATTEKLHKDAVAAAVPSAALNAGSKFNLVEALEFYLAKKTPKKKVHVQLGLQLKDINLGGLPAACWPLSTAMDKAASEAESERERQKALLETFVFVDLKLFEPAWCKLGDDRAEQSDEELEQSKGFRALAKALGAADKKVQKQPVNKWIVAYDR